MDYRAAGAAAYLGLGSVWALGLSSSSAQLQANAASLPKSVLPQLPAALAPLLAEAERLSRLADPRSLYAYCLACSVD